MTRITAFGYDFVRIRLRSVDGASVIATYNLPESPRDGVSMLWEEVSTPLGYASGKKSKRIKGYIPKVSLKWKIYNEIDPYYPVGLADGNTPSYQQLINLLTQYEMGRIEISLGASMPFFKAFVTNNLELKPLTVIGYTDVKIDLTGYNIYQYADLASTVIA